MERWYVAETHPQSETRALDHLRRQGFAAYLPRYLKRRSHARKVDTVRAPLFPGYLFVCMDVARTQWRAIRSTLGIRHLICVGEKPVPVPEGVVEEIRANEGADGLVPMDAPPPFRAGEEVLVTNGPLRDQIGRLFGDWKAPESPALDVGTTSGRRAHLGKEETAQTQIAIAYPSVPIGHAEYYAAVGAVNVLSGGMSSRLFTEVREKRGLCYAVSASYSGFKDRASVICYAGTTNERAQETLDVTLSELRRLAEGIEGEEVQRVQAGLKSSQIMQEESTSARAGTLASDWYYLGRVRPFDEIKSAIDGLTADGLVAHVRRHPPRDLTVVTLGPKPLRVSEDLP